MKHHGNGNPTQEDFIAPARRAFHRVARKLRAENDRLGLPLVVTAGNRLNGLRQRVNPAVDGPKNLSTTTD